MREVVRLDGVGKRYGRRAVLEGVSLSVAAGECVALTGANGCGKSTLLRIAGLLTGVTSGKVWHEKGLNVQYMPESFPRLNLTLGAYLKGAERIDCADTLFLARAFRLDGALNAPIRSFSKGMLSKVSAIQALAASPGLLLLDEPLSGQDAPSQAAFVDAVRAQMAKGCAVLVACHEQNLIDALASRVCRIESGALTEIGRAGAISSCLCEKCALRGRGACPREGGKA